MKLFNFLFKKKETPEPEQKFKKVNKTFTDREISLAIKWVMDEISLNKLKNELNLKSPTGCYVFVAYALKSYINKNLTPLASSILKDRVFNDTGFDTLPKYPVPDKFKAKKKKKKKQKKVYEPVSCDHIHPSGDKCGWQGSPKGLFFHKRWHTLSHIVYCPHCVWSGTAKGFESHKRIHKGFEDTKPLLGLTTGFGVNTENQNPSATEITIPNKRKKNWVWKPEAKDLLGKVKFSKSPTKFMRRKYPSLIEKI